MPSAFADNFTEMAKPLLTEQLGEAIVYLQPNASGTVSFANIIAMVGTEGASDREEADGGRKFEQTRTVTIQRSDVFSPQPNDRLTIGGVAYEVRAVINQSDSLTTVEVVRAESIEMSRPGYRGRD